MKNNPKVSICVPAYKKPELLERCLNSIFSQDFKDYEVIVTDDTPDDSITKVMEKYLSSENIKYRKNEVPQGPPGNWNRALALAEGEYIKILHHDDWFSNEKSLGNFVKLMEDNRDADIGFGSSFNIDEDSNNVSSNIVTDELLKKMQEKPMTILYDNFIGAPSATIVRNKTGIFYDEKLKWYVDVEYYLGILARKQRLVYSGNAKMNIGVEQNRVTHECIRDKNIVIYEGVYTFLKHIKLSHSALEDINFFRRLFNYYEVKDAAELKKLYPDGIKSKRLQTALALSVLTRPVRYIKRMLKQ